MFIYLLQVSVIDLLVYSKRQIGNVFVTGARRSIRHPFLQNYCNRDRKWDEGERPIHESWKTKWPQNLKNKKTHFYKVQEEWWQNKIGQTRGISRSSRKQIFITYNTFYAGRKMRLSYLANFLQNFMCVK